MRARPWSAALGLAFAGCAAPLSEPVAREDVALYGGEAVAPGEWPSVVAIGDFCTGVLIHPRVVAYAAHCGLDIEDLRVDARTVEPSACRAHPRAPDQSRGPGLIITADSRIVDLAVCVLREDAEVVPVAPLGPCEADVLTETPSVTLVGYGGNADSPEFGVKRAVEADAELVGHELQVSHEGVGSCSGDSGGPAFVELSDGTLRVAGILSSSPSSSCNENVSFYTDLSQEIAWLESATDLTMSACPQDQPEGCAAGLRSGEGAGRWLGQAVVLLLAALYLRRKRASS